MKSPKAKIIAALVLVFAAILVWLYVRIKLSDAPGTHYKVPVSIKPAPSAANDTATTRVWAKDTLQPALPADTTPKKKKNRKPHPKTTLTVDTSYRSGEYYIYNWHMAVDYKDEIETLCLDVKGENILNLSLANPDPGPSYLSFPVIRKDFAYTFLYNPNPSEGPFKIKITTTKESELKPEINWYSSEW